MNCQAGDIIPFHAQTARLSSGSLYGCGFGFAVVIASGAKQSRRRYAEWPRAALGLIASPVMTEEAASAAAFNRKP
jgi:hypothetical protein